MNEEDLNELANNILREMYASAEPPLDFDEAAANPDEMDDDWYEQHYLPEDIQEHIEELPMESMVEEEIRTQIGLMIESESYQVIDPDTLAEALSKADIQPDTRDMPSEALDSSASEEHMENHSTAYDRIIEPVFLRYPQAWLLAAGFGLLMIALWLSSPIVALSGGLLLIITVLHYGR